jgi:ComF family protein
MFPAHTARLLYDSVLTLAYPQPCLICGSSVEARALGVACENCWRATRIFTSHDTVCWKCGVLAGEIIAPEKRDQVRCRRCEQQPFTAARACGLYEGALRESVLTLKRQPYLPRKLRDLLVETSKCGPFQQCTCIVPVPLHRERESSRGFNQALVIGRALSKLIRLPVDEKSLIRTTQSSRYRAGLDAKGRQETVDKAFTVPHPRLVAGASILLVDDVFTTGATVSCCAGALIAAGARDVFVLTIARPSW